MYCPVYSQVVFLLLVLVDKQIDLI